LKKSLAIETSCDESALAIMSMDSLEVIDECIASQIPMHQLYGGVVPELAAREHLRSLPILLKEITVKNNLSLSELSEICVTTGPGLKGCLLMGVCFAEGLATALNIPLFAVNHIEAHLLAPMLDNQNLKPPYLGLVVSGGHTELIQVNDIGHYQVISRTTDDAAGEAFDKSAHLLGFPYPGGASLAKIADSVDSSQFELPLVMKDSNDFSFSGLKTAISLMIKKNQERLQDTQIKAELCHAIQSSIIDALILKVKRAIKKTGIKKVAVTGGVAANIALRKAIQGLNVETFYPDFIHCTDNAGMIGFAKAVRTQAGCKDLPVTDVLARWPVEEMNFK
jgi:N6-L-threonylcarbamoyladenine synthase